MGLPAGKDILGYLAEQPPLEQERLHKIIADVEEEGRRNLELQDGCLELLATLKANKFPFALITRNNPAAVEAFMALCRRRSEGELPHFHPVITRDDGDEFCKPKPGGMLKIIEEWQVKPEEVLVVGDHLHDVVAGRDAGCATCLILCEEPNNHHFKPEADLFISSLRELETLSFDITR